MKNLSSGSESSGDRRASSALGCAGRLLRTRGPSECGRSRGDRFGIDIAGEFGWRDWRLSRGIVSNWSGLCGNDAEDTDGRKKTEKAGRQELILELSWSGLPLAGVQSSGGPGSCLAFVEIQQREVLGR